MKTLAILTTAIASLTLQGCATTQSSTPVVMALAAKSASKVEGTLSFTQTDKGLAIKGLVRGLKPNSEHGFHIHEKGDCSSSDGLSAGGLFNPDAKAPGRRSRTEFQAVDLPNLKADFDGYASFSIVMPELRLDESKFGVLNRAVIVYIQPVEYTLNGEFTQGRRIACGVIRKSS